jgi:hypothetical protein
VALGDGEEGAFLQVKRLGTLVLDLVAEAVEYIQMGEELEGVVLKMGIQEKTKETELADWD